MLHRIIPPFVAYCIFLLFYVSLLAVFLGMNWLAGFAAILFAFQGPQLCLLSTSEDRGFQPISGSQKDIRKWSGLSLILSGVGTLIAILGLAVGIFTLLLTGLAVALLATVFGGSYALVDSLRPR